MGGMLGREHPRTSSPNKEVVPEEEEVITEDSEVALGSEQETGYIDLTNKNVSSITLAKFTIEDSEDARIEKVTVVGTKFILQDSSDDIGPVSKEEYFNALLDASQMQCSFEDGSARIPFQNGGEIIFPSEITEFEIEIEDAVVLVKKGNGQYETKIDNQKLASIPLNNFGFFKIEHVITHLISVKDSDESEVPISVLSQKKYLRTYLPSNEKIILFDENIKMLSGWIEGNDISYQVVASADTTDRLYKAFAIQQLYATVAPKSFYDLQRVALCAKEISEKYVLGRIFGSRSQGVTPTVSEIISMSDGVSGEAKAVFSTDSFSIDGSQVKSTNSRAVYHITVEGDYLEKTIVFEGICGASGERVSAITYDARIAYPYPKNFETIKIQSDTFSANIFSYYSFILGLQDTNASISADPAAMAFRQIMKFITHGLSCFVGSGNSGMVVHIVYEHLKWILRPNLDRLRFAKIRETVDETAIILSRTQTKMLKEQRKNIGEYMTQTLFSRPVFNPPAYFFMSFMCVLVPLAYNNTLELPKSYPMNAAGQDSDILDGALDDNSVLTDMQVAMMHKAMMNYVTFTKIQDIMNFHLTENIKEYSTRFFNKAPRVISSPTGIHNEFYSLDDPGFGLTNQKDAPLVANENNEFVREWNRIKKLILNSVSRLSNRYPLANKYGQEANTYIETDSKFHKKTLYNDRVSVLKELEYKVTEAGQSTNVDIARPADIITLILHKEEE